jgi:hypothetical protein
MLRVLAMLAALCGEPWVRWIFARAGAQESAPDLHLAVLCFVVLVSERRAALACAAILALWRAQLGLAAPATLLAAYWLLALLLLQMRRAFVAAGPLVRLALAIGIYGAWLGLRVALPGLVPEPAPWEQASLTRWFLTAGLVPLLLGARGGWLPVARGARAANTARVVLR